MESSESSSSSTAAAAAVTTDGNQLAQMEVDPKPTQEKSGNPAADKGTSGGVMDAGNGTNNGQQGGGGGGGGGDEPKVEEEEEEEDGVKEIEPPKIQLSAKWNGTTLRLTMSVTSTVGQLKVRPLLPSCLLPPPVTTCHHLLPTLTGSLLGSSPIFSWFFFPFSFSTSFRILRSCAWSNSRMCWRRGRSWWDWSRGSSRLTRSHWVT